MIYTLVIIICGSSCAIDASQFYFSEERCQTAAAAVRKAGTKVEVMTTCLVKPE